MTRKRAGGSSAAAESEVEAAAEAKATLDEALAELGGDASEVVLFRQEVNAPTQWPYVGVFPVTDFSLESVKREHGGGNYRARILGPSKQFRRQITFQIDRSYKPPAPPPPPAAGPAAPAPEILAILEAIKGQGEAIRTLAAEMRAAPRSTVDPIEQALKIADLVTRSSGGRGNQGMGIADALDLIDRGIELAGQNGDGGGYTTVVREFGKPLLELLQKMADKPQDPRRFRRNLPPADGPNAATPAGPQNGNATPARPGQVAGPAWLQHLAPLIPQGMQCARLDLEPESFAPAIYQIIPDDDIEAIEAAAADPNFSLTVLEAFPEMQQYREWFTRLLGAVRDLIVEGATATDEPAAT